MPNHFKQRSRVVARGFRARQRILNRLASLPIDQLRKTPQSTLAVLNWSDVFDLIELRHRLRTPKPGTFAARFMRLGVRFGRFLDRIHSKHDLRRSRAASPSPQSDKNA